MNTLSHTEILKSFQVEFNGQTFTVELLRLQSCLAPQWFFFVTIGEKQMLLNRCTYNGITMWIGGSALSSAETQLLGPEIERQLGYPLPESESNNPFEYDGDIEIRITKFLLGQIPVEKAKAPYSSNLWYRVYFPKRVIELEKSFYFDEQGQWHLNTLNLSSKSFKHITNLIDQYEAKQDNQ